jgi:Pvc16 N-terminal domain/IPT/TIG domain
MALANTAKAIGAVTHALVERLNSRTGMNITVGRPEQPPASASKRLNLFLYEVHFDGSLKNYPLDEGQRPPLWLVLKYLLTAYADDGKTSDSIKAHENLGAGLGALQEFSFLPLAPLTADHLNALKDNPEDLKITFDDASMDLLSKVMQGSDEKYRLSVAFQVRPVMIAPAEPPAYSLLVGVDYTPPAPTKIGEQGIHVGVIPGLGPSITEIVPDSFELGDTVTIHGTDLHVANLSVTLGPVTLPVTMQRPDRLQFVVREDVARASLISAGGHPVSVSQLLPSGRRRASNLLVGNLRPTLSGATSTVSAITAMDMHPPPEGWKFATVNLTGKLLGKDDADDFYVALYKDGTTVKIFEHEDAVTDHLKETSAAGAPQTARRLTMLKADAVPPGMYLLIYRVNGQQALTSPVLDMT